MLISSSMIQGHLKGVQGVIRMHHSLLRISSRMLKGHFSDASRVVYGIFKDIGPERKSKFLIKRKVGLKVFKKEDM